MAIEILHRIQGKFKGTFSTKQDGVLEEIYLLDNNNFQYFVKIFEGKVSDIKCIESIDYDPGNYDYLFNNVNNIEILTSEGWPYPNKRIFSFAEFKLKNAKIEQSWFENNKTYGIISGDLTGTIIKGTATDIDISDDNDSVKKRRVKNEKDKKVNGDNAPSNLINTGKGCLSNFKPGSYDLINNSGCWRWLKWLFWIILLLFLLRQCIGSGANLNCYWEYIRLEKEIKKLDDSLDKTQRNLNQLSDSVLNCSNAKSNGFNGITVNHHDLGKNSGKVIINYNMNMLADMMEVYYDGTLVASTDSLVSYKGVLKFQYNFDIDKPTYFTVKLKPGPHPDTKWDYTIICP